MKILVIGGGGREHALVWKLKQSPHATQLFCAPGNPGIAELAECVPIAANVIAELTEFAESQQIGLTIVGPEDPLTQGIVEQFQEHDLRIFGPNRVAARLEGSKAFAKSLMAKRGIPTARYAEFDNYEKALQYVRKQGAPIVIKADGLAAGKGVTVAQSLDEAEDALTAVMQRKVFGEAGTRVIVEEFMTGEEMTVLAFSDGHTVKPMIPSQDHKPVFDGDRGPNTGGMGAYAPVPHLQHHLPEIQSCILEPMAAVLRDEGIVYQGVLYAGLMITAGGPKVVEFNVRFGDPEAQVVLPLLQTDLVEIIDAILDQRLDALDLQWSEQASLCVVAAAEGYPGPPVKGTPIGLPETPGDSLQIFHAGTAEYDGQLVANGGRVLGITAWANGLTAAREQAYDCLEQIRFPGMHFRQDIGLKALG
ncbi:MAG: phosphoribosylamine--glycine ligase [SAR324 cluster bacterium]|jgi:phosphoribosylamine--glycine ligase|nr:phosphoribosylamine--glycine ligase [SAR324 cluster bacterium]MDP7629301.1 phosphoribosylamine--glycine ligase [SAR324 cluster bacterium]